MRHVQKLHQSPANNVYHLKSIVLRSGESDAKTGQSGVSLTNTTRRRRGVRLFIAGRPQDQRFKRER
jgi:hypothetical protein